MHSGKSRNDSLVAKHDGIGCMHQDGLSAVIKHIAAMQNQVQHVWWEGINPCCGGLEIARRDQSHYGRSLVFSMHLMILINPLMPWLLSYTASVIYGCQTVMAQMRYTCHIGCYKAIASAPCLLVNIAWVGFIFHWYSLGRGIKFTVNGKPLKCSHTSWILDNVCIAHAFDAFPRTFHHSEINDHSLRISHRNTEHNVGKLGFARLRINTTSVGVWLVEYGVKYNWDVFHGQRQCAMNQEKVADA